MCSLKEGSTDKCCQGLTATEQSIGMHPHNTTNILNTSSDEDKGAVLSHLCHLGLLYSEWCQVHGKEIYLSSFVCIPCGFN